MKKNVLERYTESLFKKDSVDKAVIYFLYNRNTRKVTGIVIKDVNHNSSESFLHDIADIVSGVSINFESKSLNKTGVFRADLVKDGEGELYFRNIKETRWQTV